MIEEETKKSSAPRAAKTNLINKLYRKEPDGTLSLQLNPKPDRRPGDKERPEVQSDPGFLFRMREFAEGSQSSAPSSCLGPLRQGPEDSKLKV